MSLGWLVVSNAGVVSNTIEDVVSLFGENLHGKVINGPWCLKMAFGLILLSFLLSFCYRFVSRKFTNIPTNTQRNAKHVTNMDESHTTRGST